MGDRILSIDTSNGILGLALMEDRSLLGNIDDPNGLRHTENLLPAIDDFLRTHDRDRQSAPLSAVAVACGPGSFTGLRIGMSTAKALALAWKCPVISVDSLHGIAETERYFRAVRGIPVPEAILPFMDARKQRYYAALFVHDSDAEMLSRVVADRDIPVEEVIAMARSYPGTCLTGPDPLPETVPVGLERPKAGGLSCAVGVALLGFRKYGLREWDDPYQGPEYLRSEEIGTRKSHPTFRPDPQG